MRLQTVKPFKDKQNACTRFSIIHVTEPSILDLFQGDILDLLGLYQTVLCSPADDAAHSVEALYDNIKAACPNCWLAVSGSGHVLSLATLEECARGSTALLHGISAPTSGLTVSPKDLVKRAVIQITASILEEGFQARGLQRINAQFDADNHGARGFCLRFGFQKNAQWVPACLGEGKATDPEQALWTLTNQRYWQITRPLLTKALQRINSVTTL